MLVVRVLVVFYCLVRVVINIKGGDFIIYKPCFSQRNLEQMRQFYLTYSKAQTPSAEFNLSWSHYLKLMRIENEDERRYYQIEAYENNWSLRELQRQFDSALYERLV